MNRDEAKALQVGDLVVLSWPGAAGGVNEKRAQIASVSRSGFKVGCRVARVDAKGRYTGEYGESVRWFEVGQILRREEASDVP